MKKVINSKWFWAISVILIITNLPGFKNITGLNDSYYRFSNISGTFTTVEIPKKGYVFTKAEKPKVCNIIVNGKNFKQTDTIVYRLFAINPIKFWRWYEYVFNWRYRLPFTHWEAIKNRRGFDHIKNSKGCMEF